MNEEVVDGEFEEVVEGDSNIDVNTLLAQAKAQDPANGMDQKTLNRILADFEKSRKPPNSYYRKARAPKAVRRAKTKAQKIARRVNRK